MGVFYDQTAKVIRGIYDGRISTPPVLDLAVYFPDARKFTAAFAAIRADAAAIAAELGAVPRFHELMPEQADISANDDRDWRLFILKAYGVEVPTNMDRCPALAAVVRECPDVLSASISYLAAQKHIPPHRGPFRGVLRFYLPLIMPTAADGRPASVLKVDGEAHRLAEGEAMLWDDTYRHEVRNMSEEVRAVLLLDVWRRGMPADMRLLSHFCIAVVRAGIKLRGVR